VETPYNIAASAYDIELDVDDSFQTPQPELASEGHLRTLDELNHRVRTRGPCAKRAARGRATDNGDLQIADTLGTIHGAKRKRDFFEAFAAHPVAFVNAWMDAQARDLRTVLGEGTVAADEQRRSALFQQPWIREAVLHYLSDRVRGAASLCSSCHCVAAPHPTGCAGAGGRADRCAAAGCRHRPARLNAFRSRDLGEAARTGRLYRNDAPHAPADPIRQSWQRTW
jgi:hypothetical protein